RFRLEGFLGSQMPGATALYSQGVEKDARRAGTHHSNRLRLHHFFYFIMEIEIVAGQARDIGAIEVRRASWKAPALRASSLSSYLALGHRKRASKMFSCLSKSTSPVLAARPFHLEVR